MVAAAASDLANLGSALSKANAAALAKTTGLAPAAADEVSAGIAALFGAHAQAYQTLSAQAGAFHQQFVQLMNTSASWYAGAEAASASPLQSVGQELLALLNAPTVALLDRPLIGDGATAAPGSGANGGNGGILFGNGGPAGPAPTPPGLA